MALLTSLVVHMALLLILACCLLAAGKPSEGILLSAPVDQSADTDLDRVETFELAVDSVEEFSFQPDPNFAMNLAIERPLAEVTPSVGPLAALSSITMEQVAENLKPKDSGRGASFFGAYAEGNRFVYVLDSSKSMRGEPWTYACTELLDSLNGLQPGQEFFIICFDLETSLLFNVTPERVEFLKTNNETIVRVKNWLRSRTLGPATMPGTALKFALSLNPDAIFLLSDGELQDNSLMMLRTLNSSISEQRQIPIHTLHLFSDQGRLTLQQIAGENHGTFTPIEGHRGFGMFRSR